MQLLIYEETTAILDIRPVRPATRYRGYNKGWDSYTACVEVPCVMNERTRDNKREAETERKYEYI